MVVFGPITWTRVPLDGPDPQLRRLAAVGLAGSLILAAGALFAGALPASGLWLPGLDARPGLYRPALVAAYLGLTLLAGAWLGLGPVVRRRGVSPRQLAVVAAAWTAPLLLAPPLYSRDVYSYIAQGAMYADGVDPYRIGPMIYGGALAQHVSEYWHYSTAPYGPLFLAVAAAVMAVAGDHVVLGVLGMRLVMTAAVAVIAYLLPALARRSGANPASALWLGVLNPLVLGHLVSGAHNDALIVALLLVAMWVVVRRPLVAAAVIALAVLVKASALVALPFAVPGAGRRISRRRPLAAGAVAVGAVAFVTIAAVTAAMQAWYGWINALGSTVRVRNGLSISTDLGQLVEALTRGAAWHGAVDPVTAARLLAMAAAAVLVPVVVLRTRRRPLYGLGLALTLVVVLGPVVHPWYLLWGVVPLAAALRTERSARFVAWACVAMAFYPMPHGGGPTADLLLGLGGVVAGVLLLRVVRPAPVVELPSSDPPSPGPPPPDPPSAVRPATSTQGGPHTTAAA